MSETVEQNSPNSQSNLIEVHHVGVTAKLQSPLKKLLPRFSTSIDSEIFQQSKYNIFQNENQGESSSTVTTNVSSPRVLYEMHAEAKKSKLSSNLKPNRIEFQRYHKGKGATFTGSKYYCKCKKTHKKPAQMEQKPLSFFERIFSSLDNMCRCQPEHACNIIDDLPQPRWNDKAAARHTCIGIYPFEHGCAEYLRTNDTHPRIHSIVLADRATTYATHFWAEFFGLLHIGVAFIVAFLLQCYRFVLYSVVNTLIVGLLHMTSDYMLKPTLTVLFNGYLQPPMIFMYNVLCSLRDIIEPVSETMNNFMKPLATVGNSIRLVNVNYRNVRRLAKEV